MKAKAYYLVHRCKNLKDSTRVGPLHGAGNCAEKTLCGQELDARWYIVGTFYQGLQPTDPLITCKKCRSI